MSQSNAFLLRLFGPALIALFARADYRLLASCTFVSLSGTWVQRIALGWLVWDLTHAPSWLGALALADSVPILLFALLGGALVDRFDRLRIARRGQGLQALQALLLAGLVLLDLLTPTLIIILTALVSLIIAMSQPAGAVLVIRLVGRDHVPSATAMTSFMFNMARFVGPVIGGALVVGLGYAAAFAFNAISFLIYLYALLRLRFPDVELSPGPPEKLGRAIVDGWRFVLSHRDLAPMLVALVASSLLARPVFDFLPALADELPGGGVALFGALVAANGAGALLGAFLLARRGLHDTRFEVPRQALWIIGVGMVLLGGAPQSWVALLGAFVLGFGLLSNGIGTLQCFQTEASDALRGRVLSIYYTVFRLFLSLGAALYGMIAETVALHWLFLLVGLILLLVLILLQNRPAWLRSARPEDTPPLD